MLISSYDNLQCKGIAFFNETIDLYAVGCSFGTSMSCSSQFGVAIDDYPIVKASLYDSNSDCTGNVIAYMAASTDKCYYQNSTEPGAPSLYEKVEAPSSGKEISVKSYSTLSTCQSSSSPVYSQKYVPNACNAGNERISAAILTYVATKSGSTTTTTTTTTTSTTTTTTTTTTSTTTTTTTTTTSTTTTTTTTTTSTTTTTTTTTTSTTTTTTTTTTSTSSSSDKGFFDTTWHIIVIVVAIVVFCLLIGGVLYYFLVIKASPSTHPTSSSFSVLPTTGKETGAPTNSVTHNSLDVVV
eukprot:CAMPEP_0170083822 /NCGR_PEP_ID=MMETSP0019_2-20121128/19178_1 /TAXON_ID=98059 /ORGANISM="Dinobryon sp., Strain UTEXLB2267" /LENGTH=296 /DNA_ID=CAMNT_0010299613 /DNA_START=331 /DNA_END=1221 /DNA_ORIENTATION=-